MCLCLASFRFIGGGGGPWFVVFVKGITWKMIADTKSKLVLISQCSMRVSRLGKEGFFFGGGG